MDSEVNEMLTYLRKSILEDKNNYSRVLIDPMYKNVRPQVTALLREIFQETKVKTEKAFVSLELNFKQYITSSNNLKLPESTFKMIDEIKFKVIEIKNKMKKNSYFDYLESLDMIIAINNKLMIVKEELIRFRKSANENLKYLENDINYFTSQLDVLSKKLNILKTLKLFDSAIVILFIFSVIAFAITEKLSLLVLLIPGIGMMFCKDEVSEGDYTILSGLTRYITQGILFSLIIFIPVLIILAIIEYFSEFAANILLSIFGIGLSIIIIKVGVQYDTHILNQESKVNDQKKIINNKESSINENRLIVNTLKDL